MKHKIKVADIFREVRPNNVNSFLGRRAFVDSNLEISIEPLRGQAFQSEVEAFYVRVASVHRRGKVRSAFEQRVSGENWKSQLVGALAAAREAGERHKKTQDAAFARQMELGSLRGEYAAKLTKKIGRNVLSHQVNMDLSTGPTGITFQVTLSGTVEQVAEKYAKVTELAEKYNSLGLV